MAIILWIVIGIITGIVVSIIMDTNLAANIIVGIIGSFAGGALIALLTRGDMSISNALTKAQWDNFLIAVAGSLVLVGFAQLFERPNTDKIESTPR